MNFYVASVATLWTTAMGMRAAPPLSSSAGRRRRALSAVSADSDARAGGMIHRAAITSNPSTTQVRGMPHR